MRRADVASTLLLRHLRHVPAGSCLCCENNVALICMKSRLLGCISYHLEMTKKKGNDQELILLN